MARLGLLAMAHGMWGPVPWADSGFLDYSVYPITHFADRGALKQEGWTGRWGTACSGGPGMCRSTPAALPPARGRVRSPPWEQTANTSRLPFWDLLVVHKVNIDRDESRKITEPTYMTILDMVLDARCEKACR